MKKEKKPGNFVKPPQYPGGKKALDKFIKSSLKYPAEAANEGIEGQVLVGFKVDSRGNIRDAKVINGLGHGCDEEALRLVNLLKYKPQKNRKLRVGSKVKLGINFKLKKKVKKANAENNKQPESQPKTSALIAYQYVEKKEAVKKSKTEKKVISYTLKF